MYLTNTRLTLRKRMPAALAPNPLHAYLQALNLTASQLEALLVAIDDKLDAATEDQRELLEPCRAAVLRELGELVP